MAYRDERERISARQNAEIDELIARQRARDRLYGKYGCGCGALSVLFLVAGCLVGQLRGSQPSSGEGPAGR